jgi:hypothetical protein
MSVRLCLTAALLILSATAATAQTVGTPGGITSGNPKDRSIEEKLRSDEIERVKRDAEKLATRPDPEFPRIKEDFERIQIINNNVLQAQASGGALDYARISEAASEIKKRAARLKTKLFTSDSGKSPKEKETEADGARDLKSLLAELDGAISGFVTNPMFKRLRVVDAQHSAKARRDLERVIKLSARVRREADKKRKRGG